MDLSNRQLLNETLELVREERNLTLKILKYLEEIDRRKLFAELGFSSLFQFCIEKLGYSENEAHTRISSMRCLRKNPELEKKIQSHELNLTQLSLLNSYFKNKKPSPDLIEKISHKTTRETKNILQKESGKPETVQITISKELFEKLKMLQSEQEAQSIEQVITTLCAQGKSKQRSTKITVNPKARVPSRTLRRALMKRANYQCQYPNCSSKHHLNIDHIKPFALGGQTTPENLRVLCFQHNQLMRQKIFGERIE